MSEQRWRIVDATGAVREVALRWERDAWVAEAGRWRSRNGDPVWCVAEFARVEFGTIPTEILAPGEMTRAEAVAAARREGAEAERAAVVEEIHGAFHYADAPDDGVERPIAPRAGEWESHQALRELMRRVCALPLPGDATPAGEVTP